jgi:hypothetical protein
METIIHFYTSPLLLQGKQYCNLFLGKGILHWSFLVEVILDLYEQNEINLTNFGASNTITIHRIIWK